MVLRRDGQELVICLEGVPAGHAAGILGQVRELGGQVGVAEAVGSATITMRIPCE